MRGGFSTVVSHSKSFSARRCVGPFRRYLSLTIVLIDEKLLLIKFVERINEGLLIDPKAPFLEQEDKLETARRLASLPLPSIIYEGPAKRLGLATTEDV